MKRAVPSLVGMAVLSLPGSAGGADGPWTLQPGEHHLYAGVQSARYSAFDTGAATDELGTEVVSTGLAGVWTYGLHDGLDLELQVPL